jgi:hypothetical protein
MNVASFLQTTVTFPAIGSYATAPGDIVCHEGSQFIGAASANDLHAQPPQFTSLALYGNSNFAFIISAPTTFAALLATKVKLVGLNTAGKFLPVGKDCASPKLLQPAPGCIVTSQPQKPLQANCINAGLAGRKPPQGLEPNCQRLLGAMKDRTSCYRLLVLTSTAHIKTSGASPALCMATPRADKALGPSKLEKILQTTLLVAESSIKFNLILWKIFYHGWPPVVVWRPV